MRKKIHIFKNEDFVKGINPYAKFAICILFGDNISLGFSVCKTSGDVKSIWAEIMFLFWRVIINIPNKDFK